MTEDGHDAVPRTSAQFVLLEIRNLGIHGDTALGSQTSGFEYTDRAQINGGDRVAESCQEHPIASLSIPDAERATNRQYISYLTEEIIWFGTEGKTVLRVALVPALATRRRSRHANHAIGVECCCRSQRCLPHGNYSWSVTLANISGTVAAILAVIFIWPQVVRVYVRRSVEGVSGVSHLVGLSGTLMWFTYGISVGSLPMVISNVNIELAIVALMVMLVRKNALPWWSPVTVLVTTAIFCAVFFYISPTVVGVAGVLIGTPAILPQAWRAIRSERLFGVSATSYGLLTLMGLGWFTHGYAIGDPVVSYPNLILMPCSMIVAWKAWISHRITVREATTVRS